MRYPDFLGKAVKNKNCLSHTINLCFQQIWGRVCLSVMAQIRSISYTNVRHGGVLIFVGYFFHLGEKVTNIRMKVKINR